GAVRHPGEPGPGNGVQRLRKQLARTDGGDVDQPQLYLAGGGVDMAEGKVALVRGPGDGGDRRLLRQALHRALLSAVDCPQRQPGTERERAARPGVRVDPHAREPELLLRDHVNPGQRGRFDEGEQVAPWAE